MPTMRTDDQLSSIIQRAIGPTGISTYERILRISDRKLHKEAIRVKCDNNIQNGVWYKLLLRHSISH